MSVNVELVTDKGGIDGMAAFLYGKERSLSDWGGRNTSALARVESKNRSHSRNPLNEGLSAENVAKSFAFGRAGGGQEGRTQINSRTATGLSGSPSMRASLLYKLSGSTILHVGKLDICKTYQSFLSFHY